MSTDNLERMAYMLDFIALPFPSETLSGECGCGHKKSEGTVQMKSIGEKKLPIYTSKRQEVEKALLETLQGEAETLEAALDGMSEENMTKILSYFDVAKIDSHLADLKAFESKERIATFSEIKEWDRERAKDSFYSKVQ